jgi:maltose/moltooligosaccharide transporter
MNKSKPHLSFWQIWNMSFGFLGIQFGFALQNANVSRIFETLGAKVENIPILWIAAPVTGLIIQPIIGHMSDNTWNRLGRRRPYFLTGAILASLALILMPNSPVSMDSCRNALDNGRIDQYLNGTIQGFCR